MNKAVFRVTETNAILKVFKTIFIHLRSNIIFITIFILIIIKQCVEFLKTFIGMQTGFAFTGLTVENCLFFYHITSLW